MIKIVSTFKTNDGKEHKSAKLAREHIENTICENVSQFIGMDCGTGWDDLKTKNTCIRVLFGDIERTRQVLKIVGAMLNGEDDTIEEEKDQYDD